MEMLSAAAFERMAEAAATTTESLANRAGLDGPVSTTTHRSGDPARTTAAGS